MKNKSKTLDSLLLLAEDALHSGKSINNHLERIETLLNDKCLGCENFDTWDECRYCELNEAFTCLRFCKIQIENLRLNAEKEINEYES